ncbi:MAG: class II aldolase/adducin family protein [Thermodesulfobacteriota bacterium]|nr:class II aldolase/adducin family protein [Thermodesulfobacteriota bacterium]
MMEIIKRIKEDVRRVSVEMLKRGLVLGTMGNCSARVSEHNMIAITPRSMDYNLLRDDDIVLVDYTGKVIAKGLKPSIELPMHLEVYRVRKDISAIVHTHSVFACAIASTGNRIPPVIDELMVYVGGEVELAEYAIPGTKQLAVNTVKALGVKNAVLLANHGMVGVGKDLKSALLSCEIVEKASMITIYASFFGKINTVPSYALRVEREWFEKLKGG